MREKLPDLRFAQLAGVALPVEQMKRRTQEIALLRTDAVMPHPNGPRTCSKKGEGLRTGSIPFLGVHGSTYSPTSGPGSQARIGRRLPPFPTAAADRDMKHHVPPPLQLFDCTSRLSPVAAPCGPVRWT